MFSSIGNIVGSGIDAGVSMYNARQAQKHQEKMFKHRYQWQTKDMRKAGINPMLSISQSPPGAGSSPQAAPSDFGGSFSRGVQSRLAREQMKTQQTQQAANVSSAKQADSQAAVYAEQAAIAAMEREKAEMAMRHWRDQNEGAFLSSAKATQDAGLDPYTRRIVSGAKGVADWISDWRARNANNTTAKEGQDSRRRGLIDYSNNRNIPRKKKKTPYRKHHKNR